MWYNKIKHKKYFYEGLNNVNYKVNHFQLSNPLGDGLVGVYLVYSTLNLSVQLLKVKLSLTSYIVTGNCNNDWFKGKPQWL